MKAKLILVLMLLLATLLPAQLAFDEGVTLFDYDNYRLGYQSVVAPNGNTALIYSTHTNISEYSMFMQIYSSQNMPILNEPVSIGSYGLYPWLVINPDSCISMIIFNDSEHKVFLNTYSPVGILIPERSNITMLHRFDLTYESVDAIGDGLGGVHLCISSDYDVLWYQHVSAQGSLAHPVSGLRIPGNYDNVLDIISTKDHGAVMAIRNTSSTKLIKMGSDHQISWQIDHPEMSAGSTNMALRDAVDDSFFAIWETPSRIICANHFSYDGSALWTENWMLANNYYNFLEDTVVISSGNLVINYYSRQSFHHPYTSSFLVLNPAGESIYNQWINPVQPTLTHSTTIHLVADNDGGWFEVGLGYDSDIEPNNFIQHFTADFSSWPSPVVLQGVGYQEPDQAFCCQLLGDDLRILYESVNEVGTAICSQQIDSEANLTYPEPGLEIMTGIDGRIFGIQSVSLPNGSCFILWRDGYGSTSSINQVFYNVITPDGNCVYPEPQCFLEEGLNVYQIKLFALGESNVLVCWTKFGLNETRAQLMSLDQGALWEPEGRSLFAGSGGPILHMYNDSLYMARITDDGLRLHRFVDGIACWEANGILAATINPDYQGDRLNSVILQGNRLFWNQNSGDYGMVFMNEFAEDGSLLFQTHGFPITILSSEYVGFGIQSVFGFEGGQVLIGNFIYRVWEHDGGPQSPYSWHYYAHYKPFTITQDGDVLEAPIFLQNRNPSKVSFIDGIWYVVSSENYQTLYMYSTEGDQLGYVTVNNGTRIISLCNMADGNMMIIASASNYSASYFRNYCAIVDAEHNLYYPPYSEFSSAYQVYATSAPYGVYLFSFYGSFKGMMQYVDNNAVANSDPHNPNPTSTLSQNFPNPFNDKTSFSLNLKAASKVKIDIYNLRGQQVKTLCNTALTKGNNFLDWDGKDDEGRICASGVYILKADAEGEHHTMKLLKMK